MLQPRSDPDASLNATSWLPSWPTIATITTMLLLTETLDRLVRPAPRVWRSFLFYPIRAAVVLALAGILLSLTGSVATAAIVSTLLVALIAAGSNAKSRILGEPLCFTDLTLLREMASHPQFYWGAIPWRRRLILMLAMLLALVLLGAGSTSHLAPRLAGLSMLLPLIAAVIAVRVLPPWQGAMRTADLGGDIARHGLLATLLVYPLRLLDERGLLPVAPSSETAFYSEPLSTSGIVPLVVVVQCESFADPADLPLPDGLSNSILPGLQAARRKAWQDGELLVSGFGAYTMRTEYGVLFGRGEEELGFRRYDPFLTIGRVEYGDALPRRLSRAFGRCRATFLHPHSLRFYRRDRLMPNAGFSSVLGEPFFAGAAREGPYVSDEALGSVIEELLDAAAADQPDLIYAVSIENHGPWTKGRLADAPDGLTAWLHHVRNGDRLLSRLITRFEHTTRPVVFCFFGDHRPSIPPIITPGGPRHTPFAMMLFPTSHLPGPFRAAANLTPADLHKLILKAAEAVAA